MPTEWTSHHDWLIDGKPTEWTSRNDRKTKWHSTRPPASSAGAGAVDAFAGGGSGRQHSALRGWCGRPGPLARKGVVSFAFERPAPFRIQDSPPGQFARRGGGVTKADDRFLCGQSDKGLGPVAGPGGSSPRGSSPGLYQEGEPGQHARRDPPSHIDDT